MSEELKDKDQLDEAQGSRPADQSVGDKGAETVTPESEQKKEPSTAHDRGADQGGELPAEGDTPKDEKTQAKPVTVKESDDEEDDEEEMDEGCGKYKEKMNEGSEFKVSAELGSLLESEDLSEEFQEKAVLVFEAAVNAATKSHLKSLDEKFDVALAEAKESIEKGLNEKTEKYLDYAVQEWVEENKLAIVEGVRTKNAESFMEGLKDLLEAHYVELPEGKADMYQEAVERQQELGSSLDEQIEKNADLQAELNEAKKELVIEKHVAGMTLSKAEKIRSLAEGVEFESEEEFQAKLGALTENYFPSQGKTGAEMVTEDAEIDQLKEDEKNKPKNPEMAAYIDALNRM